MTGFQKEGRKLPRLAWCTALAVFLVAAAPATHTGFLADDFFAGVQIERHAVAHPGFFARLGATFTSRWVDQCEFFRPLTLLSLQLDYAVHGIDGGRHHWTNIVLWVLVSWISGRVFAALLCRETELRWLVSAATLLFPAGVESISWLVARQDLLLALFGLAFLDARLRHPASPLRGLLPLALAFLSKETAIILPPLALVIDLVLAVRPSPPPSLPSRLARWLLPWGFLAAWFGIRLLMFGTLGSLYNGQSYFQLLTHAPVLANFATSVGRLLVPINALALSTRGWPWWPFALGFAGPLAALMLWGVLRARAQGDGRRALIACTAIAAPIALLSPTLAVGSGMTHGRALVIPGVFLLGLAATALLRLRERGVAAPVLGAVALPFVVASAVAIRVGTAAYETASARVDHTVRSLDTVPDGARVLMLRLDEPGVAPGNAPGPMRGDIEFEDGAYLLSGALPFAFQPPFRRPLGLALERILPALEVDALSTAGRDGPQPAVVTLPPWTAGHPAFLGIGPPGDPATARGMQLEPAHGSRLVDPGAFDLRVRGGVPAADTVRFHAADLAGTIASGTIDVRTASAPTAPGSAVFSIRSDRLSIPVTTALLRQAGAQAFIWWAEGISAGRVVWRTPWALVRVDDGTPR